MMTNRKNLIKDMVLIAAAAGAAFAINGAVSTTYSSASPVDNDLNSLYQQLVTEGKNYAKIHSTSGLSASELYDKLILIDKPDTPYDGCSLDMRGTTNLYSYSNGDMAVEIVSDYTIAEADKFTDDVVAALMRDIGDNATDREKLYAILDFVDNNYHYDNEEKDRIVTEREAIKAGRDTVLESRALNSFITAYGREDIGITCSNYAELTYLLADKMGVDCKILVTDEHAFNIVRLDDESGYVICDPTYGRYGIIDTEKFDKAEDDRFTVAENIAPTAPPFTAASRFEDVREFYYLLFHGYNPGGKDEWFKFFFDPLIKIATIALATGYAIAIIRSIIRKIKKATRRRRALK